MRFPELRPGGTKIGYPDSRLAKRHQNALDIVQKNMSLILAKSAPVLRITPSLFWHGADRVKRDYPLRELYT